MGAISHFFWPISPTGQMAREMDAPATQMAALHGMGVGAEESFAPSALRIGMMHRPWMDGTTPFFHLAGLRLSPTLLFAATAPPISKLFSKLTKRLCARNIPIGVYVITV